MRNNIVILDTIRQGKNNFHKKEIHQKTGIAWGTMCKVITSLLENNYIFARKEDPVGRGRPVVPLCINAESAYFMGIDIGSRHTKTVICDLAFNTLYHSSCDTPPYSTPDAFFSWLFALFDEVLKNSRIAKSKLFSIGLAVSGNIDSENGILVSAGNIGIKWGANFPLTEKLSKHAKIPAYAVTTQVAAAWAEYQFGPHAGCANIVTIGLGVGIGSGVVSNHHLLISQPGRPVGYIGHMLIPGNKRACTCSYHGCLESYSGGRSLASIAKEKLPKKAQLHSAEALDKAAGAGDPDAVVLMKNAASYNAVGVASMIQLYSPDVLIFSGRQCRKDGFLYQHTLQAVNEIIPEERQRAFTIELSVLGPHQSALGAARLAYEQFF